MVFLIASASTRSYTLSLHDALPISLTELRVLSDGKDVIVEREGARLEPLRDRKSTRLNSSHEWSSYAVFCLKKNTATRAAKPSSPCPSGVGVRVISDGALGEVWSSL